MRTSKHANRAEVLGINQEGEVGNLRYRFSKIQPPVGQGYMCILKPSAGGGASCTAQEDGQQIHRRTKP
ncbi:hypothetical protein EYF80_057807 [Liparis tanakae]|uniref:Uncharacterized protein n=1 Tax=Liparis tanakae TaxID=230148 RepID=A0A4Z2ET65_9TELE|nr:hypothetical protein EYF80_057807 [Liparis tanakae]